MLQRVMLRFSVETFLSHSTETFPRGNFLCCVSETFWWRKSLWKRREEGDYKNFPSNFFCLTVPKHFVEEPFCAVFQKTSGGEKVYGKDWGVGSSKFPVENFLSHSTETFCRRTLLCCVSENFCWRKSLWKRIGEREYRCIPSETFCLKMPKSFERESFSLSLISGIERIYASEGYVAIFRRNFFVLQYRNIS